AQAIALVTHPGGSLTLGLRRALWRSLRRIRLGGAMLQIQIDQAVDGGSHALLGLVSLPPQNESLAEVKLKQGEM
ncbi:UNVERIFIED_CONTAM: hypothetical protein OHV15_17305, partial [Microbacterium sp. SLM126]